MSEKITCAICINEEDKACTVKKNVKVAVNKRRRCGQFVLEPTKVKAKQILKTTRLTFQEKEALRQHYKEELKRYKKAVKEEQSGKVPNSVSPQHPLTGDLSRFTSTARGG